MKIFDVNSNKNKKPKRKRKLKREKSDGKDMLMKLHPMAFSILAIKCQDDRPSDWVRDTFSVINDRPSFLTDKWVASINKWVESNIESMSLDEPKEAEGDRVELGPFKLLKIIPPKQNVEYPMPAIMLVDKRGWKWYFKTSKSSQFSEGQNILLTATISSHKEGITFLKRPSKIRVADDEVSIF